MRILVLTLLLSLLVVRAGAQSCCEANEASCASDKLVTKSTEGFVAMAKMADDPAFRAAHRPSSDYIHADAKGTLVSYPTSGAESRAYYVSAKASSDKALLIIHDWRGLTDEAKSQADAFAERLGYQVHVLAIDLYDGKVGTNPTENRALMQALTPDRGKAIVAGAKDWLNKATQKSTRIATLGWCMGGSWSFTASLALGEQAAACVIYYGQPVTDAEVLKAFAPPALMHVPELDKWITPKMGEDFKTAMSLAGKSAEILTYPGADHAFANPTGPRYVSDAAKKADDASVEFLKKHLLK